MSKATHILSKFRPMSSGEVPWVGTMKPRKQIDEGAGKAWMEKGKTEPIVAFSRPPPIPPFLGPLVALSMLESVTKRDNNDD